MSKLSQISRLLPVTVLAAAVGGPSVSALAKEPARDAPQVKFDSAGRLLLGDSQLLSRLGIAPDKAPGSWEQLAPTPVPVGEPKVNMMCPCAPQGK